jgi:phage terminase small subunit
MSDLTPKQEQFAQLYVELGSAAEAYRRAYKSKGKPETCQRTGHECLHNPKVAARIQDIRDEIAERGLWKRLKSVEVLSGVALNGEKDSDRVSAVKALNAMYGWDAPVKVDHTTKGKEIHQPIDASKLSDTALQELISVRNSSDSD